MNSTADMFTLFPYVMRYIPWSEREQAKANIVNELTHLRNCLDVDILRLVRINQGGLVVGKPYVSGSIVTERQT